MCEFKVREGVVLGMVAGVYMLISTYALREICPYVKKINEVAAFYFEQIKNGHSKKEILDQVASVFHDTGRVELERDFDEFIGELIRCGYLVKCSEQ